MNVNISYKLQRTTDIDRELHHWTEKIQKRLQVFRPELVHLKGSMEQNPAREGATVSLNLRLPSGQMAVQRSAPVPVVALKAAFGDLLAQISKHKDLLRNSRRKRRQAGEGPPAAEVPFEQTMASIPPLTASADDIRSFINTNFRRLTLFVERELFFRESSGQFRRAVISSQEIVDEAVARALDETIEKPDRLGLEPWIYRLAIRAMDDFEAALGEVSREDDPRHSRADVNEQASDEQQLQFHPAEESTRLEDLIPDDATATPEEIAYSDEMIALVHFALRAADRQDREAFILHAIEGFSLDEIGAITDRRPEQVRDSIQLAREKLRHSFSIKNSFSRAVFVKTGTD